MKTDRIASIVFIVTGLIFWTQTGELQYNCSIFPRLLIIFMVFLSAVMLIQTFLTAPPKTVPFLPKNLRYITTSTAVAFIWIYLLNILGFIVSSVLCLTALTFFLDLQRPTFMRTLSTIAVYTLMVGAFWLIFHNFLLVPLPTGYLI
ncbi:MAG: tripartite tricarboxylate transporter TctB family protein [Deltaproteobacteria bacterium]|nr:tripartite tricarboxylate transporter TctB family protein [Deltaproteobacteria bacterium]